MAYLLLSGILVAFSAPLLYRWMGARVFVLMLLFPLLLLAYFSIQAPVILAGHSINDTISWVPALGINLQFRLDGLSLLFSLLIAFFGLLIILYSRGYLGQHPLLGRFYMYLILFMVAMLGVVTSDNIFCLFLFWELTSISSFLLIGFNHEQEKARAAAWQALLVTGAGGLALLGGLLLLSHASGENTFSGMLESGALIKASPLYLPSLLLILLGCFTKSAQFPFHFWLPNAMAAPTPVSAYLHSATMVKAGIYLLARLTPALGGTDVWQYSLVCVGGATALLGAILALQHIDLKAILAYTTISSLGLLVAMTGVGTTLAMKAMLVFLVAHALYKGTLFLVAGAVDHSTGTRELHALQGLGSSMRWTGAAATLGSLSMAGVIPFVGFMGKELLYEASLESSVMNIFVLTTSVVAGVAFVAVALLLSLRVFWKKVNAPTPVQHAASPFLYIPPLVLGLCGLALGLFGNLLLAPVVEQAAHSVLPRHRPELALALWHGLTPVFWLSLLTLLLGGFVYRFLPGQRWYSTTLNRIYNYGPDSAYHMAFNGFLKGAKIFIHTLQNGFLRNYIIYIILFFCGLLVYVLRRDGLVVHLSERRELIQEIRLYEVVLSVLVAGALLYLLGTRSRLTSIVVMGLIGYSAALFYILFGAPDVAATQLLIETLTVVMFVLLLHKMPAFSYLSHQFLRYYFIAISVLFGAVMTYVLLLVQEHAVESELKRFYGENSYLQAHGKNIVNVILVDFRGLDTMGEITVLAVAAIGVFALLRLYPKKGGKT